MGTVCKGQRDSLFSFLIIIYWCSVFSSAANRIGRGQLIRDGGNGRDLIISGNKRFALGFFSPENSVSRYVGIWYYGIPNLTAVWVANREKPITGNGGVLSVRNDGNLEVLDGNGDSVWSTAVTIASSNSTAILTDIGNLVLVRDNEDVDTNNPLWQSFSQPTDTYLPNMRVYMNIRDGENRIFTSWRSPSDPAPGNYSMGVDPRGSPQIVIWDGPIRRWRSGHWNGLIFTGIPGMRSLYLYGFRLYNEGNGTLYFTYTELDVSDLIKFQINWKGNEMQQRWDNALRNWSVIQSQPADQCELYNKCGPFGKCDTENTPICSCLEGFVPMYMDQWSRGDWSGGCVRRTNLQCPSSGSVGADRGVEKDGFLEVDRVKLPDFADYVDSVDARACERRCQDNCSCTAYAFVTGISCLIWSGPLVDIKQFGDGGSTLYIRLAHSELGAKSKVTIAVITVAAVVGTLLLMGSIWLALRFKARFNATSTVEKKKNGFLNFAPGRSGEVSTDFSGPDGLSVEGQQENAPELAFFSFSIVAAATDNFSADNRLGEGGFGQVYRGQLPGGKEIAVKRLSRKSGQGLEEFKNEITLIAKLQHRNLVRLLGCCIQGEEKMLIYEYMPNNSLDSFIFDSSKQAQLDWEKRFTIIEGIARGLLYLHRDSRLRIIHRDLKASNILLDEEMNPKISDFGMARIFGRDQNEANTNRVVGTYGYMAPEYAMEGLFSLKSDVYSFGVLLLEIISGSRNNNLRSSQHRGIVSYAWDLWDRGRAIDLIDASISKSCCRSEALRCIHIAMLCVQDQAVQRPSMSAVVLMLETESVTMPMPREPTFTSMRSSADANMWNEDDEIMSSNHVTITTVIGR